MLLLLSQTGTNSDWHCSNEGRSQVVFEVTKKTSAAEDFTYEISELQRTHTRGESGSAAGTALLGNQAVMAGVEYSSSDDTVVKLVDNKGAYQCVGAGTATITVTATYDDPDTGKKYQKKVNLAITVKDIEPAKTELIAVPDRCFSGTGCN